MNKTIKTFNFEDQMKELESLVESLAAGELFDEGKTEYFPLDELQISGVSSFYILGLLKRIFKDRPLIYANFTSHYEVILTRKEAVSYSTTKN